MIQAAVLLIWPIFGTMLISFTWSFKCDNYSNSFSNKTVTISMDCRKKNGLNVIPFAYFNNTIIVQLRYLLLKQKKLPVLEITDFFFAFVLREPDYSSGKKTSFYPIRATSFISIIMYLIRKCSFIDIFHIFFWRSSNTNPTKNRGWTQVLRKGRQFLFH